jgi:hypothetical protein
MIILDAHVHIHDCFNLDELFNSAYSNFHEAAELHQGHGEVAAFLLLTEGAGQHRFREIMNQKDFSRLWRALPTGEAFSLQLARKNHPGFQMFLIAGRQLVTSERLEVLALLSGEKFEEGRPLDRTVEQVRHNGALPVLPWGAGKWLGRRGRTLRRFLENMGPGKLFLADNRCRPGFWQLPDFVRKSSLKILAGTDPLPFRWEEGRAGSFGSILWKNARAIDARYPAASLHNLLTAPDCNPQSYGRPEALVDFCRNQAAMQLRKHFSA